MKFDETATVVSQNEISDGIYDMWIDTGNIAANAVPGQFISVYTKDASKLLPRPISICETDGSRLRIIGLPVRELRNSRDIPRERKYTFSDR